MLQYLKNNIYFGSAACFVQCGKSGQVSFWSVKVQDQKISAVLLNFCTSAACTKTHWKSGTLGNLEIWTSCVGVDKGLDRSSCGEILQNLGGWYNLPGPQPCLWRACGNHQLMLELLLQWSHLSVWSFFQSFLTYLWYRCSGENADFLIRFFNYKCHHHDTYHQYHHHDWWSDARLPLDLKAVVFHFEPAQTFSVFSGIIIINNIYVTNNK